MQQESDFFGSVAQIALGIFVGGLLLWGAFEYRARYELRQLDLAARAALREAQDVQQRADQQRIFEASKARRAAEQRALQLQVERRERQRAATESWREFNADNRRKEAAWAAFYQPAPECEHDVRVECGNEYIRARQEFERRYAAGQL